MGTQPLLRTSQSSGFSHNGATLHGLQGAQRFPEPTQLNSEPVAIADQPIVSSKSFSKRIKSQIENLPTFTQKDLMNTGRVLVEILVFCIDSPIFLCIIYDYYKNKIMQSKKEKKKK